MRNLNNSKYFLSYSKLIHDKLCIKYCQKNYYNIYTINNILANNKSLVVSKFKEFQVGYFAVDVVANAFESTKEKCLAKHT